MHDADDAIFEHLRGSIGTNVDAQVARGDLLFSQCQFEHARRYFLVANRLKPDAPEILYRLGIVEWRLGRHLEASRCLQRAIERYPDFPEAHGELARVLLAQGLIAPALLHSERAFQLAPADENITLSRASVLAADGQGAAAARLIDSQLRAGRESTDLAMILARVAPACHRQHEALDLISRLVGRQPSLSDADRSALHFAAAGLLDGLGRFDDAFAHASTANALRKVSYEPRQVEAYIQSLIDLFTTDFFKNLSQSRHTTALPVFIIGMPRSGTSLVEQILASHPLVHGGGERDAIANLANAGTPSTLNRWGGGVCDDLGELAEAYLGPLRALNPQAVRITDKMPLNFLYAGMISTLFPDAAIIHCRRDRLDTCLSCFMTNFAVGHEFSFSLHALSHFYRHYERLMTHWRDTLHRPMLEVNYEHVVSDLEGQSRRLINFVNLPWDQACLSFHENKRFVATASHQQVRQPVYKSSAGRWRHYEKHLGPLITS